MTQLCCILGHRDRGGFVFSGIDVYPGIGFGPNLLPKKPHEERESFI